MEAGTGISVTLPRGLVCFLLNHIDDTRNLVAFDYLDHHRADAYPKAFAQVAERLIEICVLFIYLADI